GDEIFVLDDIVEQGTVDVNKSFTLNTNNHVVSFSQISGMASRTITGGGVLNTALDNSNTNGSDVLTVDGATLNLAGTQWMAKNVAITNSGNITLTSNIFLGGGDEDGFNLSIDEGSSFKINGQSISGYNTERVAAQIGQYLPSGYTVSDDLVFSPDANVTLSVQSAEPITYTAEAVTTCFNEWDEGEFVVTASDMVEGSYVMTFGSYELTTQRTDGVEIYFELKNIPAGTYNVTVWNSDKSKQLCTSTLTILDASLNVEGPEEGVTNEPLTFTVTNPVSGVTYEWVVEMYGGDSNSPADPSSYTADSFEGTSFTVTFLEADEYYRISCNSSCGYGTEMALSIQQQVERTYYVHSGATVCSGQTATVKIAAPQGFANASGVSVTNANKRPFECSVADTLLTVELSAGTYYLYDDSDDPVLEFSVETVTMSELEINGSDNVAIVGEMEQTNMGWSYSVPYTDGNTYDWTCSGDVSVTSKKMGTSHYATVRFTAPGDYVLSCTETNANGCSQTVTKNVTVEQYTYTIPQNNVVMCSGDNASVTVIITCNTVEGFNGQFAVAKDYTTDKLASYTIEEGDDMAKAYVTITEPGTYNLYYGGDEVDDVYYR
ncbi:MAG: hypothetical protein II663_05090, partial [Bacteroidales bacterium]|nr:hypothetical protein [Bacteroidales bacterium]